jgi:hypothetical protein
MLSARIEARAWREPQRAHLSAVREGVSFKGRTLSVGHNETISLVVPPPMMSPGSIDASEPESG